MPGASSSGDTIYFTDRSGRAEDAIIKCCQLTPERGAGRVSTILAVAAERVGTETHAQLTFTHFLIMFAAFYHRVIKLLPRK